jgi:hypothetical protein
MDFVEKKILNKTTKAEFGYMENLELNGMKWNGLNFMPWNINNMEWNFKNMEWNGTERKVTVLSFKKLNIYLYVYIGNNVFKLTLSSCLHIEHVHDIR